MAASLGLAAVGLGAAALLLLGKKKSNITSFTSARGRKWLVELVKKVGNDSFFGVIAPAGSFGPHVEMRVMSFRQTGNDVNSRILVANVPGVPEAIVQAAHADFLPGTSP